MHNLRFAFKLLEYEKGERHVCGESRCSLFGNKARGRRTGRTISRGSINAITDIHFGQCQCIQRRAENIKGNSALLIASDPLGRPVRVFMWRERQNGRVNLFPLRARVMAPMPGDSRATIIVSLPLAFNPLRFIRQSGASLKAFESSIASARFTFTITTVNRRECCSFLTRRSALFINKSITGREKNNPARLERTALFPPAASSYPSSFVLRL